MVATVTGTETLESQAAIAAAADEDQELPAAIAKAIVDMDTLIKLLVAELPRAKPWQRQLASHLAGIDGRLQIIRLTISLDRGGSEVLQEAEMLYEACRRAGATLAGSRADHSTRSALQLAVALAAGLRGNMELHLNELAEQLAGQ